LFLPILCKQYGIPQCIVSTDCIFS